MFSFIHTSDLHLGKPFGRFDPDLRARLREVRHRKISALAEAARTAGATHVLLAGDTFDAETPPPQILRQAIRAFAEERHVTWVLLPGNHDSLAAGELWSRLDEGRPPNVILALEETPIPLAPGIHLLPSPCPVRRPARDLTDWMDGAETPDAALRIGLAHGPITDFGDAAIIAPDRAATADLDYLALGDWHGRLAVGPRTHYAGTPEPDSFKHDRPATALHVTLAPGAEPTVTEIPTGEIAWRPLTLDLRPGDAPPDRLTAVLPPPAARRDTLVALTAQGRLSLSDRAALEAAIADVAPDFGHFEADLTALSLVHDVSDLDEIDPGSGALRSAAEALLQGAEDPDPAARRTHLAALSRLYGYALDIPR